MCSTVSFCELDDYLTENGLIEEIYKSLQNEDKGEAVVMALEIMKKTNKIPAVEKALKQADDSRYLQSLANQFLLLEDYKNSFYFFNQALRCAPKGDDTFYEAYFGRSKLFYITQSYNPSACLTDISRCLTWKNSGHQTKLKQMKEDCKKRTILTPNNINQFDKNFFSIDVIHPKVPCVSAAVDFIIENEQPKVVAEKNIPVGMVVAVEKAYIGNLHEVNIVRACHYCHAFSLNLIPCDSCRHALFCDEKCKTLCWEEYHNVECHIIHVIEKFSADNIIFGLSVRAALKLKNLCSWKEFLSISSNLGLEQMTSDLIAEVYDVHNKSSILRCNNDRLFVFGATYNAIFIYAIIIHHLEQVPSFFPRNAKKKDEAIRALSRVLVHLYKAYGHIVPIENCTKNFNSELISSVQGRNYGLFSFTSKLKHSCDANLYVVGLNNKVALIALKPIKGGEELTIAVPGHWYEYQYHNRALSMFMMSELKCRCLVCVEGWSRFNLATANLDGKQKKAYEKWNLVKCAFSQRMVDRSVMFKETSQCLNAFHDLPNTIEHKAIFDAFRHTILCLQFRATNNFTVLVPVENVKFATFK